MLCCRSVWSRIVRVVDEWWMGGLMLLWKLEMRGLGVRGFSLRLGVAVFDL